MESKNKKIKAGKKTLLDKQFLTAIQPQGGICFKDKYVKKGDGYEACIHVWNYPSNVNMFWLNQVMSMYDMTVVADIGTMEQDETISAINKNMVEQDVRYRSAKKESDRIDADRGYQEVESLYRQISQTGEVIKLFQLRLFLAAPDIEELDKKVKRTMSKLHALGFKGQIFLNETYYEWQSLFLPYDKQTELPNKREGKGIPAITLAAGLPYDFSELNDRTGSYLGSSSTGGNVMFDLFHSDKLRRFYNGVVIGKMGAGKSTALKKLLMDNEARGNFIRGFDVTGEFKTLINTLGGKTISLDGSDGIINPLQIYRSDDTSNYIQGQASFEQYERQCFMQHISKVAIFYEFLAGNPSKKEIEEFKKLLRMFYESFGFMEKLQSEGVTTLNNEAYPVFNDLLIFIREQLYDNPEKRIIRSELSVSRVDRLEKIELVIDNLVNSYGTLFNGHTTLEDITNEQVIFFSIRNLTKLEKNVFHAQMYNTLNLIWDNLIQIGGPQKDQLYQDEAFDADDATRFLIMIDEAHRLVNADNMLAVSFLTDFAREARKYFGGMLLASQSIRDFVPDHKDTDTVTKIRTLFELTQYKFVMQQDSNTLDSLRTIFEGQLTESELEHVPQLQQGECILSISGVSNIMMTIEASDEELKLFEGGL